MDIKCNPIRDMTKITNITRKFLQNSHFLPVKIRLIFGTFHKTVFFCYPLIFKREKIYFGIFLNFLTNEYKTYTQLVNC